MLCYFQELSNREAAEVMDVSVNALESYLVRGRRKTGGNIKRRQGKSLKGDRIMNEVKLNEYLKEYGKSHNPEPSRALIDNIMNIPREVEQLSGFSWKISDWFLFLVPRLSGLNGGMCHGYLYGKCRKFSACGG